MLIPATIASRIFVGYKAFTSSYALRPMTLAKMVPVT
jgi:hypothetical protein